MEIESILAHLNTEALPLLARSHKHLSGELSHIRKVEVGVGVSNHQEGEFLIVEERQLERVEHVHLGSLVHATDHLPRFDDDIVH